MNEFQNGVNNKFSKVKVPKPGKHFKRALAGVAGVVVIGILATDATYQICLLYTSDAADDGPPV